MKVFAGLVELLKNFTTQINDNNLIDQDISDDNFVAVAIANGMNPAAIAEMTRTRNGIQLPTKKRKEKNAIEQTEKQLDTAEQKIKIKEKNKELER